MNILRTPSEMQQRAQELRAAGRRTGLVPTMGALHEGHLALIRLARKHADVVVVSIFVNPTQFGQNEDIDKYPRDFPRDEEMCKKEGVDIVFYPEVHDMYLPDASVYVVEEKLSQGLCGASRPGHFRGVCTIVAKLFNLVLPDIAVFGEKDGQQLRIIERMVRDLNFPVRIIRAPTVREPDGLAMSSRNAYLSRDERTQAGLLKRALDKAGLMYTELDMREAAKFKESIRKSILHGPDARADYIEIVDDKTLEPVEVIDRPCMIAIAAFIGKTRLIDNIVIGREQ